MVWSLVRRGLVVGAIAGLLAGVFAFVFGEPRVQDAIDIENAASAHASLVSVPLAHISEWAVSRGEQRGGLFLATALYGLGAGDVRRRPGDVVHEARRAAVGAAAGGRGDLHRGGRRAGARAARHPGGAQGLPAGAAVGVSDQLARHAGRAVGVARDRLRDRDDARRRGDRAHGGRPPIGGGALRRPLLIRHASTDAV